MARQKVPTSPPEKKNGFCYVCYAKRGIHLDPSLKLSEITMPVKQEHKFLGVTFKKKQKFPALVADRVHNILKVLSNKHWASYHLCSLLIYCSVVRCILDYGCIMYGSARQSYPFGIFILCPISDCDCQMALHNIADADFTQWLQRTSSMSLKSTVNHVIYVLRIKSSP